MNAPAAHTETAPHQTLTLFDAVTMIVGLIVGAGIFGTPALVAGAVQSESMLVAVWIAGGVFSIIGALCYAELATAFPSAGGEYHFIQKAFGRQVAFLYGWSRMTVVVAGSIAVFAYLFGDYMAGIDRGSRFLLCAGAGCGASGGCRGRSCGAVVYGRRAGHSDAVRALYLWRLE